MNTDYYTIAHEKLQKLRDKEDICILGIESSCDDTAIGIIRGNKVLANQISSQIFIHQQFGGVVPEIASRNHVQNIDIVLKKALEEANISLNEIDCIAVTYGAGLQGSLLVGVAFAKALAFSLEIPLIPINHIRGHICANFIDHPELSFPFLCLLASGGHTEILKVNSYSNMEILGQTRDDAAGEAFDKVARILGFNYPGGPEIEKYAKLGSPNIEFSIPLKNEDTLDFSYSGLKTNIINYVHNYTQKNQEYNKYDVAASFQKIAVDMLVNNAIKAAKDYGFNAISIAGGVAANTLLRERIQEEGSKNNITVYIPTKVLCTDNGLMIAKAAHIAIKEGIDNATLNLDVKSNLD
ncbi:MAG: tRNA (adenosine(37)-N6)-threonylcarbamoyltransferase complex transferase subunit TsaD [Clostridia bacterium]|nr:tRNA (adenosine(37)-N6)-threonylcarbamoyltransferase complex transferase subunit TsaD [Clostridia bacterium]